MSSSGISSYWLFLNIASIYFSAKGKYNKQKKANIRERYSFLINDIQLGRDGYNLDFKNDKGNKSLYKMKKMHEKFTYKVKGKLSLT